MITAVIWGDPTSALLHGEYALELAHASNDKELEGRSLSLLGLIHLLAGGFEEAMYSLEASLALLHDPQAPSQEWEVMGSDMPSEGRCLPSIFPVYSYQLDALYTGPL
jgi:hypothetical protein